MANLLDRFNTAVVGARGKIADYLPKVGVSGDFKRVTDMETILNSWTNILVTPTRSYLWDPAYGSDLYKMVFEPADEVTIEKIKQEVYDKLTRYDDRASITNVEVLFGNNSKTFTVNISATYKDKPAKLSVVIDESVYFKFFDSTT
jgi:phage baseplate assembly protein W